MEQYQEVIKIAPDDPNNYNNLAFLYTRLRLYDQAVFACQQALKHEPNSELIRTNLGMTLYRMLRYSRAAAEFRQALGLNPNYAPAQYTLAAVLILNVS